MQRRLFKDIRNIQLGNMVFSGVLILGLSVFFFGNHAAALRGWLIALAAAGFISGWFGYDSIRHIRADIEGLERIDGPGQTGPPPFRYAEFAGIAAFHRSNCRDLNQAVRSKAELLANCPWGYAVFDAAGKCLEINENGTAATGIIRGSFLGGNMAGWRLTDRPERSFKIPAAVTREVIFHPAHLGKARNYLIWAFPTGLAEGEPGIMVWFIDTTAQKQDAEKTKRLAALVEGSADAIFGCDAGGAINTWNQGAAKMYGYSAAEIVGKNQAILVPPELQEQLGQILKRVRTGSGVAQFETERIRKDGARLYVSVKISLIRNENGEEPGFSTIHRDITDKKRYEENLRAEQERLTVTLNSIDAGVIATDKFGRIVFLNQNAGRLTGWPVAAAMGQPLLRVLYLMDNRTSEAYEGLVAQVLRSDTPLEFHHVILVNRDLQEMPISISCAQIRTAEESFAGVVLVFQDISEKLKIEAELLRAEKLESLGILAGGIAHDFNNILAAVVANLQLAMVKYEKGQDISGYLGESVAISQRASELTKQLLTFSKGGAPVKKAAALVDLIQDTTRFVLHGSKVKAIFQIAPDSGPVLVDEGQISQVIHNLILNASQVMPEGGLVRIKTENVAVEPGNRMKPGRYVKITVNDTGPGIPKEILPKIFDPYFTTKKEGNGLGLATAYSIIKRHEGYIGVESTANAGTTFTIHLPVAAGAVIPRETAAETAVAAEGARILLMDDEEVILKIVGEMMKYYGYHVTLARDGAEAIRYYQEALESGEPFDAVVMDLTIPGGMGGAEAIVQLRELDPGVRAIVSSGYSNDPVIAAYHSYGFCGMVRKPYRFEELNRVLSETIHAGVVSPDSGIS